jgi:hypothetical protein
MRAAVFFHSKEPVGQIGKSDAGPRIRPATELIVKILTLATRPGSVMGACCACSISTLVRRVECLWISPQDGGSGRQLMCAVNTYGMPIWRVATKLSTRI